MEDMDHNPKRYHEPIMNEVLLLEASKRYAAQVANHINAKDVAHRTQDDLNVFFQNETMVVYRRLQLLSALIKADDIKLCLEVRDRNVKTCARYRHMQIDTQDENENLFEVRSPLAWQVNYDWDKLSNLLQHEQHPQLVNNQLNALVKSAIAGAVRDESTKQLTDLYASIFSPGSIQHLEFEHKAGDPLKADIWQQSEASTQPQSTFTAIWNDTEIQVVLGSLDINYCDEWHNPLINKFVRDYVKLAASAMLDDNEMGIIIRVGIKLRQKNNIFILELAPFVNPDVCSVQHIMVADSPGISHLEDKDINDVGIPEESKGITYFNPQFYNCIGAHRNIRLNEQELNFLHAEAFKETDTEMELEAMKHDELPKPNEVTKSKSARISFTGWDILVTTFHIPPYQEESEEQDQSGDDREEAEEGAAAWGEAPATNVTNESQLGGQETALETVEESEEDEGHYYTIITLVNYPPFGTKYKKEVHHPPPQLPASNSYNRQHQQYQQRPGFRNQQQTQARRYNSFKDLPKPGNMFHFPIYHKSIRDGSLSRGWLNVIDHSADRRQTQLWQSKCKQISARIWENFHDHGWVNYDSHNLKANIIYNENKGKNGETVFEMYRREYKTAIEEYIRDADFENEFRPPDNVYLYTVYPQIWKDMEILMDKDLLKRWEKYTNDRYEQDKKNYPDMKIRERSPSTDLDITHAFNHEGAQGVWTGKILLPASTGTRGMGAGRYQTIPEESLAIMNQMKERIQSLEQKLQDERHTGNRDYLLKQVLDKLTGSGSTGHHSTNHHQAPPRKRTQ